MRWKNKEEIPLTIQGLVLTGDPSLICDQWETRVQGVAFVDLNVPGDQQELEKRLTECLGKDLSIPDSIEQLKKQIVLYYREHQYPVVKVVAPKQEITGGVLQLAVIEGKVGEIKISGNRYIENSQLAQWLHLKRGESINEKQILQDLSWINANPFRNVSITYLPGKEYGATEILVNVEDRRPIRFYTGGDNTGSEFTGQTRWFTGVNFANFFYPENILSYQFSTANSLRLFLSHSGQFILPLPWRHTLSAFGAYATVNPSLSGFTSTGKSYQASGRYEVPIWFTYPSLQQALSVGFDFKGTNNNVIFGSDVLTQEGSLVNIAQFVLGYHLGLEPPRQKIDMGIDIFCSPGQMLSHQSESAFHTLNPKATAKYVYTRLFYAHEGLIYRGCSFFSKCRIQLSDSNLIPSEQLALGGYDTVRGYFERVVNTDNGLCLNFEVRSPHYSPLKKYTKDDLYLLAFIDFGFAWDHSKVTGLPLTQTLIGIGPGLRYRIASYFNMRFDLGFPLHKVASSKESPRIHLSAVLSY